jgi:programmed cell death protein 4
LKTFKDCPITRRALCLYIFRSQQLTIGLLENLTKSAVITYDQLKTGMLRLFDDIEDIQLDVPNVYEQLQSLLKQLGEKKILNNDITSNAPQKGRKRITSEGENNKQEKD